MDGSRPRHPAHGPAPHPNARATGPQPGRPAAPPAWPVAERPAPLRVVPAEPPASSRPSRRPVPRLPGAPLLVLAALALEVDALARALPGACRLAPSRRIPYGGIVWSPGRPDGRRPPVFVLRTGMGGGPAAEAGVLGAIEAARPSAVLSAGFAGALDPAVPVGHLVLGDPVVDPALPGHYWPAADLVAAAVSAARRAALGLTAGPLVSVGKVEVTAAGKAVWASRSRGLALDMESASVARAAAEAGLPFLALRAVSDATGDPLPDDPWRLVTADGRTPARRALRYLAARPAALPRLLATGRRARRAALALAAFLAAWLAEAGRAG